MIDLVESAAEHGNTPVGSLLVVDDTVVRTIENTTLTDDDIAAHRHSAQWAASDFKFDERPLLAAD